MKSVGIVIPCYNEGPGLLKLIERIADPNLSSFEFLLIDNGSTDETPDILSRIKFPKNVRTLRIEKNQGYGFGILKGLKELNTDYVGWTHGDLQSNPSDLSKFLEDVERNSPYMKGLRKGRPILDRFFTFGMSCALSIIFQRKMRDINAQPNILRRDLFEDWPHPPHDFSLDLYAYVQALKKGHRISRREVHFGRRDWGSSHWNSGLRSRLRFINRTIKMALSLRITPR
jgi:polyisoprenyl-phosphate glycosyltransferase